MKRVMVTILLCVAGPLLVGASANGDDCTSTFPNLDHPWAERDSWCWATCISIATRYFTRDYLNSHYSQCEIVTWACLGGLLDNAYCKNCWSCCEGFNCSDYAPTGQQFGVMLQSYKWGFVHSRIESTYSPYDWTDVYEHLCGGNPVIITFCNESHCHSTIAEQATYYWTPVGYLYLTGCIDPYDGELKFWETGVLDSLTGYGRWFSNDFISPREDNEYPQNPRARVAYFLPVLENGHVMIEWGTRTEKDTDFFQVQRCFDEARERYETVSGRIVSKGNATQGAKYEYVDPAGKEGDAYRLIEFETTGRMGVQGYSKAKTRRPSEMSPPAAREYDLQAIKQRTRELLKSVEGATPRKSPATENYDWVAIYPAAFASEVGDLISWRSFKGFNPHGATTEDINGTYGGVKAYIQDLWDTQAHSLKYVFLVGDASSCAYSPPCSSTTHNMIPIYRYEEGFEGYSYYSDLEYGDIDNDDLPEVAIGRLPAASTADVAAYVDKVIWYEQHPSGSWVNNASFLICDKNMNFCTGGYVDSLATLIAGLIPSSFSPHYKSMDALFPNRFPEYWEREAVAKNEFNSGRSLILAMGTTSNEADLAQWLITAWCEEDPFRIEKLQGNSKFPFVVGASCDIGNFTRDWQDSNYPPITEELLFSHDAGAIAMFSPTGATDQEGNYELCNMLFKYLYDWGAPSLGHACLAAQKRVMARESMSETTAHSYVFLGDPAIRLAGSVYASGGSSECLVSHSYYQGVNGIKSFYRTCPAGDLESMVLHLNFEYDYGTHPDIPANSITLGYDPNANSFRIFSDGPIHADSAATNARGYHTTITYNCVGDCGCGELYVLVNGDTVGTDYVCFRGPDLTADGYVNLSDLAMFGPYNTELGKPGYNHCSDFNGDDACNLSDLAFLGGCWGERYPGFPPLLTDAQPISNVAVRLTVEQPAGESGDNRILVKVGLDQAQDVLLLGIGLSSVTGSIEYKGYYCNPDFPGTVLVARVTRDGKECVFISSFGDRPIGISRAEMVTLEFTRNYQMNRSLTSSDFTLSFGEVMGSDGAIKTIRGIEPEETPAQTPSDRTFLGNNYPNPFNPTTIIEYGIAREGQVNLSIYNVAGQLVRTLASEHQRPRTYKALWDGKDNGARDVASGVYLYKLETVGFKETKKLVLLR